MINLKKILLLLSLFTLFVVVSCEKHYALIPGDKAKGFNGVNEDADDYTGGSMDTVFISFNGSSLTSTDIAKAAVSGTDVTIKRGGTYCISGTTSNGQIIVNSTEKADVRIILKRANITCYNSSPIYVKKAQKVIIVTLPGTKNYLTDGTVYIYDDIVNMEPDACIFSKSDLTFYGTGSLYVNGNFKDGITGRDGLIIKSGTINVTSSGTAIKGKDYLLVYDGDITLKSKGDGLKSTNSDDPGAGFVWIKGGNFSLTSATDAVSAYSDITIGYANMTIVTGGGSGMSSTPQGYRGEVSAKGFKAKSKIKVDDGNISINSADEGIVCDTAFVLKGGVLNISTMDNAVHSHDSLTVNGGYLNVMKAQNGFIGSHIKVTGGHLTLDVSNNAINGTRGYPTEYDDGSLVSFEGGTIILGSLTGDGLTSNGSATITGGTIVINGPFVAPDEIIHINGNFDINGGFLIASGPDPGNMTESTGSFSTQYSVLVEGTSTIFTSASFIHIQDASNTDLVTFKPGKNASFLVFSSPALTAGKTYNLYTGGTYSVSTNTAGYYYGGFYSGGTLKKTFTLSSKITSVSL
jgi:hypothetical protein